MKNLENQSGFAVLEVILVAGIIAILAKVALPQMAQLVDKTLLDYEMKRLYSTVELGRSINKSATYKSSVFPAGNEYGESLTLYLNKTSYQLEQNESRVTFDNHKLPTGFSLSKQEKYSFNDTGNWNGSITLTSRLGHKAKITFDSVGRVRGHYE